MSVSVSVVELIALKLCAGYLVVGAMTAGFQLCQFKLMLKLAPAELRATYLAIFLAATSLLTAQGPSWAGGFCCGCPSAPVNFSVSRS